MPREIQFPSPRKKFWRVLPHAEAHKIAGTAHLFYRVSDLLSMVATIAELGIDCKRLSVELFLHYFGDPTSLYIIGEPLVPGWYSALPLEKRKKHEVMIITDGKTTIEWAFELPDKEIFTLYDYYDSWSTGWRSYTRDPKKGMITMRDVPDSVKRMQDLIIKLLNDLIYKFVVTQDSPRLPEY